MRGETATWFITTAKYDSVNEQGLQAKITENNIVKALTFGDAETKTMKELSAFTSGECQILREKIAPFTEIFFSDKEEEDKWYSVSVKLITIDEKTDKERKTTVNYLVQGRSTANAEKNTNDMFKDSAMDYEISKVAETNFVNVWDA